MTTEEKRKVLKEFFKTLEKFLDELDESEQGEGCCMVSGATREKLYDAIERIKGIL